MLFVFALLGSSYVAGNRSFLERTEKPKPTPTIIPTSTPVPKSTVAGISIEITPKPTSTNSPVPTNTPTLTPQATSTPAPNQTSGPKIDSIDPSSGNWQETIIIKGSGFGSNSGSVTWFNQNGQTSAGSPIESWSDTEVKARISGALSNYDFTISVYTSDGKQSNKYPFKVMQGQPYIGSISPQNATLGSSMTLDGEKFGSSSGKVVFYSNYPNIAGEGEITFWSETKIEFKLPSSLENGKEYAVAVIASQGNASSSVKFYTVGN